MTLTACIAAATFGTTGIATAAPAIPTFNLFIPGTWETDADADPTHATGTLSAVARTITKAHGDSATIYFLPYMARAFDNGQTYATSKATAIAGASKVLAEKAAADPRTRFTISGYSQGADAAGDLASAIGNGEGPISADKVLAVGLLADPGNGTAGQVTIGPSSNSSGIADPRPAGMGDLSGRVSSICDPSDLYCSIDKHSNPLIGQIGTLLSASTDDAVAAITKAADVVEALVSIDFLALADELIELPQLIATGDLKTAYETSTSINTRLNPLVTLADMVDYRRMATILDLIPDKTGMTKVSAAICRVLANVDFKRTAAAMIKMQDLVWSAAGAIGEHTGATTLPEVTVSPDDVLALGRELAELAIDPLIGAATGNSDDAPGVVGVLLSELISPEFPRLGKKLATIVAAQAITNPTSIVRDAVAAKGFYEGQSHSNYARFVVDDAGHNAISWLGSWLTDSIATASTSSETRSEAAPR